MKGAQSMIHRKEFRVLERKYTIHDVLQAGEMDLIQRKVTMKSTYYRPYQYFC